jgi:uncharacterized protein (DUF2062 family)
MIFPPAYELGNWSFVPVLDCHVAIAATIAIATCGSTVARCAVAIVAIVAIVASWGR